jgi:DNA-binding MarR family transcriptional regulator
MGGLTIDLTNIRIPDTKPNAYFMKEPKSMNPRTLYLIKRAEIEVTSRMARALEQYDITPMQFTVLYFVDYDKGDLSSAQLSRRFSMTPQSMNELVGVLERKKLLKKTTDPSHKRILRIAISLKGKRLLQACNHELDVLEVQILKQLNAQEIKTMRDLLGKILEGSHEL